MTQTKLPSDGSERRIRFWLGSNKLSLWREAQSRGKELSWVLAGKLGLVVANAALMLLLAHRLELEAYGILVVTIGAQLLISRFLMIGVDMGIIRLSRLPELIPRAPEVVKAGLIVIVSASCILVLLTLAALPMLIWFHVPLWILTSIILGAIGTALLDYYYGFRLSRHEYNLAAISQGGTAFGRLVLTIVASILFPAYPSAVFVVYHGASFISGIALTSVLVRNTQPITERGLIGRLLRYSSWQGASNVTVIFSLHQGTFLLILLGQEAETAIYGLALTLSLGFGPVRAAYNEYLLARISLIRNFRSLTVFLKRAFAVAIVMGLACVPIILVVSSLLYWLLPSEMSDGVRVFRVLAVAMVLLILQSPLEAACHYLLRPKLILAGWAVRVIFIGAAGLILVPQIGAMGAAFAQLIGSGLGSLTLGIAVLIALRLARRQLASTSRGLSVTENPVEG